MKPVDKLKIMTYCNDMVSSLKKTSTTLNPDNPPYVNLLKNSELYGQGKAYADILVKLADGTFN